MAPVKPYARWITASTLSIETCLAVYLAEANDTENTPHYCRTCRCDQIHTSQKRIQSIGSVVIIHLQRFHSINPYALVDVPRKIDMQQYTQDAGMYMLCSAIRHDGNENMGHYTCSAKTNKGWMQFNDLEVSAMHADDYLRSSMIFIYVKSDR
jgi:ubiquitin C-terminal hydrolase